MLLGKLMEDKLRNSYCLLLELVDPRYTHNRKNKCLMGNKYCRVARGCVVAFRSRCAIDETENLCDVRVVEGDGADGALNPNYLRRSLFSSPFDCAKCALGANQQRARLLAVLKVRPLRNDTVRRLIESQQNAPSNG
ncbi:hypothetical protein PR048_010476 [Dryococelus australis]|uniref:Uncharacterized protein n=1 Tax=Dryococelus australis TaxID=614101 RepID=A0ABQ9I2W2_9NEOP|nr:hypothetical protein PR048_010476 [Dryococelus australis]